MYDDSCGGHILTTTSFGGDASAMSLGAAVPLWVESFAVILLTLLVWATLRTLFKPRQPSAVARSPRSCPNCRVSNPGFASFCRDCGKRL